MRYLGDHMTDPLRQDPELEELRRAVEAAPEDFEARRRLAWTLCTNGQAEEGLVFLREVIRHEPGNAQNHAILGDTLLGLGQTDDALAALQEAIRLSPEYCFAHFQIGRAHAARQNLPAAIPAFRKALALRLAKPTVHDGHLACRPDLPEGDPRAVEPAPTLVRIVQTLVGLLVAQERFDQAMEVLQQGLSVRSDEPNLLFLAGQVLQRLGRHAPAERVFRALLEVAPALACGHLFLARTLRAQQRLDEAIDSYRRAGELDPRDPDAPFELGTILSSLDRLDEALEAYSRAAERAPEDAMCHYNLGCVRMKRKAFPQAILSFERARSLNRTDPRLRHNLGISLRTVGRFPEAVAVLQEAVELDPRFSLAWRDLGVALSFLERYDEAIAAYRQSTSIDPRYATAWFDAGLDLAETGRFAEAATSHAQALALEPDFAPARRELLFCAIAANQRVQAEKALDGDPLLLQAPWPLCKRIPDRFKASPLHLAAFLGHAGLLTWLLDAGANPATKGPDGATPLALAREFNRQEAVAVLLSHKAEANPQPPDGDS